MKTRIALKNKEKFYIHNLNLITPSKKKVKPSDIISLFGKIEFIGDYNHKKERQRKK